MRSTTTLLVGLWFASAACSGDDQGMLLDPSVLPADYAATFTEVRNCRLSVEHDLVYIRVLAAPDAVTPYTGMVEPFPAGAIVAKQEYADNDPDCAGPIVGYTLMQKLEDSTDLGWRWQKADAKRFLIPDAADVSHCIDCHTDCGKPPNGYDGTCTQP